MVLCLFVIFLTSIFSRKHNKLISDKSNIYHLVLFTYRKPLFCDLNRLTLLKKDLIAFKSELLSTYVHLIMILSDYNKIVSCNQYIGSGPELSFYL